MKANEWISFLGALSSLMLLLVGISVIRDTEVVLGNPSLQEISMFSGDIGAALLCAVVNGIISMVALSRSGLVGDN